MNAKSEHQSEKDQVAEELRRRTAFLDNAPTADLFADLTSTAIQLAQRQGPAQTAADLLELSQVFKDLARRSAN